MATINVRQGSEGPSHDPYGYTEIEFISTDGEIECIIHSGLAEWIKIKVSQEMTYKIEDYKFGTNAQIFEQVCGISPHDAEKVDQRRRSRCRKCGSKQGEWTNGYPGESFLICVRCGNHMDYSFNESAII